MDSGEQFGKVAVKKIFGNRGILEIFVEIRGTHSPLGGPNLVCKQDLCLNSGRLSLLFSNITNYFHILSLLLDGREICIYLYD